MKTISFFLRQYLDQDVTIPVMRFLTLKSIELITIFGKISIKNRKKRIEREL